MNQLCVVFLAIFVVVQAFPTQIWEEDLELSGGFFEGDLDLTEEQQKRLLSPVKKRNGLTDEDERWPNNTVYFKVTEKFDGAHYKQIITALQTIESISCIRFLPANSETKAYINVTSESSGCHAKVGYQGKVQQLNLQPSSLNSGCFVIGTIIHEFLHALGFYHQHSTYNRNDFVKIVFDNIQAGNENNFYFYHNSMVTDFGVGYDYGSILHYSEYAFSKNGEKTIVPLFENESNIGQRKAMSDKDITKLNLMYKCPNFS